MASYTLQGFTNDASSADLDATNLNEMDNAIKKGHDFADGASVTPSAGKAMVWPSNARGVFEPTLTFGGDSVGVIYLRRSGRYTISAGVLHFWIVVTLTSKGTSVGALKISGLPSKSGDSLASEFSLMTNNIAFGGYPVAYMGDGANGTIKFESENADGTFSSITDANCANNSGLYITGMCEM